MISVEAALAKVCAGFRPLDRETIAIEQALGRALAEDVASQLTHPPTAVSAMDGYAVRAADVATVPCTLTQIGESRAGLGFEGEVKSGETVRIYTGARLPEGADSIVIQENVEAVSTAIRVLETAPVGKYIRPAGLDFKAGDVLLKQGRILAARDIGLLASMNVPTISAYRKPRIAIMSTGDELVMAGQPVGPDQIINSNSYAMAAYITTLGGEPVNLGIARDTEQSLRDTLAGAKGTDLLVTIGGASVGDYDLVQSVMNQQGLDLGFYKIAMRPGKPLIFGQLHDVPVLGLPGNPVSAGVISRLFLKAAMDVMLGQDPTAEKLQSVRLGADLEANDQRQDYLRARLQPDANGELTAVPFNRQDSSMMARFAQADCLIVRAPHAAAVKKGETVSILAMNIGRVGF
ncbi:MAG: molybdopterin molybdotransferase MoeA [Rhodospirillales bacterium]|nr:molybdopterin molybdotransferase MoeA [Rhodospirillales bacterium]